MTSHYLKKNSKLLRRTSKAQVHLALNSLSSFLASVSFTCFPCGSVSTEAACHAKDVGSISGSGRPLEKGYATQSSILGASLVAQMVNNPTAMRETWVRSLGWEDPLKKGKATHSSILTWRIPWTEPGRLQSMGWQRVGHDWAIGHARPL